RRREHGAERREEEQRDDARLGEAHVVADDGGAPRGRRRGGDGPTAHQVSVMPVSTRSTTTNSAGTTVHTRSRGRSGRRLAWSRIRPSPTAIAAAAAINTTRRAPVAPSTLRAPITGVS